MSQNPFKMGDKVIVYGYDSTATYNHGYTGVVVDSNEETVKVKLELQGYHTRVYYGQCALLPEQPPAA
jgi:ribosomal protein L21E